MNGVLSTLCDICLDNFPPAGIGQSDFCKKLVGLSLDNLSTTSLLRHQELWLPCFSLIKNTKFYSWTEISWHVYRTMYHIQRLLLWTMICCIKYSLQKHTPICWTGLEAHISQKIFAIIELTVIWKKFAVNYFYEAGEPPELNSWIFV